MHYSWLYGVKKFVATMAGCDYPDTERREKEVVVWGTGQATRDFIHVGDVALGVFLAAQGGGRVELFQYL